ncbi:hypothetical protein AB0L53_41175 [Nonomuraea sp. NPDC052129]
MDGAVLEPVERQVGRLVRVRGRGELTSVEGRVAEAELSVSVSA